MLMCAGKAPAELCRTVCMVQIFPLSTKEAISDCPACLGLQPEAPFQQYDVVHALLEVSIDRNSFIPLVMRLRWFPTTSGPQFADAGLQVCDPPHKTCCTNAFVAQPPQPPGQHCICHSNFQLSAPPLVALQ